jgi:hypothetical protein
MRVTVRYSALGARIRGPTRACQTWRPKNGAHMDGRTSGENWRGAAWLCPAPAQMPSLGVVLAFLGAEGSTVIVSPDFSADGHRTEEKSLSGTTRVGQSHLLQPIACVAHRKAQTAKRVCQDSPRLLPESETTVKSVIKTLWVALSRESSCSPS